jgi:hypothetical protein
VRLDDRTPSDGVKWRKGARVVGGDGHKALVKKVCCVIFKGLGNQILVALEGWDGQAGGEGWLTRPGHTEDLSINLIIARHGCVACVQCIWVNRGREGNAERSESWKGIQSLMKECHASHPNSHTP